MPEDDPGDEIRAAFEARMAELEKLHAIIRVTDTKSVTMKEVCPSCGEQFDCFHNGYINQLVQSNETLWATTKAASEQDMYWHDDALALRGQLAELENQGNRQNNLIFLLMEKVQKYIIISQLLRS